MDFGVKNFAKKKDPQKEHFMFKCYNLIDSIE
jgi:hypothetical protein